MIKIKYFGLFLSLTWLFGCVNNQKSADLGEFGGHSPFQEFQIKPQTINSILSDKGMFLVFPPFCFEYTNGTNVTTEITILLREYPNTSDLILNGISTLSNETILTSDGVFHVFATSLGDEVKLKRNEKIYVEFPTAKKRANMKIFKGIKSNGTINWVNPSELNKDFITLPIDYLGINTDTSFLTECNFKAYGFSDSEKIRYNSTYIATREFEQRYFCFRFCDNNYDLFEIYKKNIHLPLWYSDSLAIEYLQKEINGINKDDINSDSIDYVQHFNLDKFISFKNERLTFPIHFPNVCDSLNNKVEIIECLVKFGISPEEAEELVMFMNIREEILKQGLISNRVEEVDRELDKFFNTSTFYSFFIYELGWINIDAYYEISRLPQEEIHNLQISNETITTQSLNICLLILEENIVVKGTLLKSGKIKFSSSEEIIKFPSQKQAILIATSTGEKNYLGFQQFTIGDKGLISVVLKEKTLQEIDGFLQDFNTLQN